MLSNTIEQSISTMEARNYSKDERVHSIFCFEVRDYENFEWHRPMRETILLLEMKIRRLPRNNNKENNRSIHNEKSTFYRYGNNTT